MTQTDNTNTDQKAGYQPYVDELQVIGEQVLTKVKELLHEGNVRRITIKQEARTIVEFPLTFGVVGALLAPMLAVVGTGGALVAQCSIEVVRVESPTSGSSDVPPSKD